jgi:hypothetical protein
MKLQPDDACRESPGDLKAGTAYRHDRQLATSLPSEQGPACRTAQDLHYLFCTTGPNTNDPYSLPPDIHHSGHNLRAGRVHWTPHCAVAIRCSIFPASAHEVERRSVEGATRLPAPPNATRGARGFSCSDICYCSEMRYMRPARTEVAVGSRIDVLVGPRKQSLTAREIEPSWPTAPNPVMWSRCEDERRPCVIQCSPAYAGCLG